MRILLALVVPFVFGCSGMPSSDGPVRGLDGRVHEVAPMAPEIRTKRAADVAAAALAHRDAAIWLGRRTAYLGDYRGAIRIYGHALELHPDEPRLLRHRGHRHLTVRAYRLAIEDLERASARIEGTPDEVEQDGLPNARGIPTSTLHFNIWYHLGLAYYLVGDYPNAVRCYDACVAVCTNADALCAATYWLSLSHRRSGFPERARAVLDPISADMDVIENRAYHRLCLLFRGDLELEAVLEGDTNALQNATASYGIAQWHFANGREVEGNAVTDRILASPSWAAFGFLAAEADRGSL